MQLILPLLIPEQNMRSISVSGVRVDSKSCFTRSDSKTAAQTISLFPAALPKAIYVSLSATCIQFFPPTVRYPGLPTASVAASIAAPSAFF